MRPALVTLLSLVLGIYLGSLGLLAAQWYFLGIAVATLLLVLSRLWHKALLAGSAWYLVLLCMGACLATIPRERVAQLPQPSEATTYLVTISRPPTAREQGSRAEAIIEQATDPSGATLIRWSGQRIMLYLYNDSLQLTPRTSYLVRGRLTPLDQVSSSSYQHYLLSRKVFGVLSASTAEACDAPTTTHWSLWNQLRYRAYTLQQRIGDTLDEIDRLTPLQRETLRAICLGDRSEGTVAEAQFRSVGVAHLLSVSGFHVGVVLLLIYWLIRYPLRLIRNVRTAYLLRWSLTLVAVWLYAFVCGLSIPTLRASLMFSIFAVARLLGRSTDRLNVWAQAAVLLLIVSPYALFDVGMQLSFGAVLAIFVTWGALNQRITPSSSRIVSYLYYLIVTTLAVQLFVWPILARSFGSTAVWLLLANLLLSPLATLLIITGLVTMGLLALGLPTTLLPMLLVGVSDLTSGAMALLEQHFTAQLTITMPLWLCVAYYLLLYAWVQYLLARPRNVAL